MVPPAPADGQPGEDGPGGPLVVAPGGDEALWRRAAVLAGPAEPLWQVRAGGYRADVDADAWPVGFSPTGEALPDALTDVLLRGSHWVRSARLAEAERRERSAAVAAHVEAQLAAFLKLCAEAELVAPVTMRVVRDAPRLARARHRAEGRPRAALRAADDSTADLPQGTERRDQHARGGGSPGRWHGRNRPAAWPVLYWRCESFPSAGRSLHLFVEPGGRTFEGRDLPAPLTVLGRQVRVWPVDVPSIVEGMAEVDARRCALHLVDGMARLLWRAGVGL
nr:hypothetical protein [Pseudofrankia saprophytica]